jgi:hypothetical protein
MVYSSLLLRQALAEAIALAQHRPVPAPSARLAQHLRSELIIDKRLPARFHAPLLRLEQTAARIPARGW